MFKVFVYAHLKLRDLSLAKHWNIFINRRDAVRRNVLKRIVYKVCLWKFDVLSLEKERTSKQQQKHTSNCQCLLLLEQTKSKCLIWISKVKFASSRKHTRIHPNLFLKGYKCLPYIAFEVKFGSIVVLHRLWDDGVIFGSRPEIGQRLVETYGKCIIPRSEFTAIFPYPSGQ